MATRSEIRYLGQLIEDFSPPVRPDPSEAYGELLARFHALEQSLPVFFDRLKTTPHPYPQWFFGFCRELHYFLFNGILTNAGKFRSPLDPNAGFVGFGGERSRRPATTRYRGSISSAIEDELRAAMNLLRPMDSDPVSTAMRVYQKFVRIHPFYDANGRIARFLVTVYLDSFGYYVRWKPLDETKKNEFLKKLNNCHDREGQESFERYFEYLNRFWHAFVVPKSDLESMKSPQPV